MSEGDHGDGEVMPQAEALKQILIMTERLAMLYHHFASTLVAELGEEKGTDLIARAIQSYGTEVGRRQRQRVVEAGYAPDCENYGVLPDLPRMAWSPEGLQPTTIGGQEVRVCPLAKYWLDKGAASLGRLYCYVDQAKYAAFDPEAECRHPCNVLDGDDHCEVVARKRTEWERIDSATTP